MDLLLNVVYILCPELSISRWGPCRTRVRVVSAQEDTDLQSVRWRRNLFFLYDGVSCICHTWFCIYRKVCHLELWQLQWRADIPWFRCRSILKRACLSSSSGLRPPQETVRENHIFRGYGNHDFVTFEIQSKNGRNISRISEFMVSLTLRTNMRFCLTWERSFYCRIFQENVMALCILNW